jgi:hypothetical protein
MIYIEPAESEKLYQELEGLGDDLKVPVPRCFLQLRVTDRTGKITHHTKRRSHSWTRNAYNLIASYLLGINAVGSWGDGTGTPIKITSGSVISGSTLAALCRATITASGYSEDPQDVGKAYIAASGDITHGIVAGIGAGAESFDDYAMSSICGEGSGANQLHYVQEEQPALSWDAGTRTLTITHKRYMNNNSSGTITLTEIGIIANGAVAGGSGRRFMTARDVLSPPVEVPPSGQILASYILSLVYPS